MGEQLCRRKKSEVLRSVHILHWYDVLPQLVPRHQSFHIMSSWRLEDMYSILSTCHCGLHTLSTIRGIRKYLACLLFKQLIMSWSRGCCLGCLPVLCLELKCLPSGMTRLVLRPSRRRRLAGSRNPGGSPCRLCLEDSPCLGSHHFLILLPGASSTDI